MPNPKKISQVMQKIYDDIVTLTDAMCAEHLNDEYAQFIRYAMATLCRKRPLPLNKGRAKTWACGITYAIGSVNFIFDKSQVPSLSAADLCGAFGVSKKTGGAKATEIRRILNTYQLDPNWSLPSNIDSNPMAWMIQVNGFIVDARSLPRETQEIAFKKGLIPYLPN